MLALVTCSGANDDDLARLLSHLPDGETVVWDDDSVDWSGYAAVVIRSTWDYPSRQDEFLAWAHRVAAVTTLWNPLRLIEWNIDKRYLRDLAGAGLATVPSWFVEPGDAIPDDIDLASDVVVKPTVGAGSRGVVRSHGDAAVAVAQVDAIHAAGGCAMVQPYRAAIDDAGETGLVYVGDEFSHAFSKAPILASEIVWEDGLYARERIEPSTPSGDQLALGERVVAWLGPTAYARVDLVPGPEGPEILEVELIEPYLFLSTDPSSAERAAAAFRRLDDAPRPREIPG